MAAVSDSGGLPDLVGLSDDEIDSLEENEHPSEEDEAIISSWVADLPRQSQQMQEQQLRNGVALPAVAPAEDDDRPANFEECRKMLDEFFSARVYGKNQTMTWQITENLPRKKKDTEFDKLLQTLRVYDNRRYVSQRWLMFRKARGVVPPPVYKFENVRELLVELEKCIDVPKVVQESIRSTQKWLSTDHMLDKITCYGIEPQTTSLQGGITKVYNTFRHPS